jgi:hypothetical protein
MSLPIAAFSDKNPVKIPNTIAVGLFTNGSFVGAEYEIRKYSEIGFQFGGGFFGYGFSINYHLEPTKLGAYFSLGYEDWDNGYLRDIYLKYNYRQIIHKKIGFQMGLGVELRIDFNKDYLNDNQLTENANKIQKIGVAYSFCIFY